MSNKDPRPELTELVYHTNISGRSMEKDFKEVVTSSITTKDELREIGENWRSLVVAKKDGKYYELNQAAADYIMELRDLSNELEDCELELFALAVGSEVVWTLESLYDVHQYLDRDTNREVIPFPGSGFHNQTPKKYSVLETLKIAFWGSKTGVQGEERISNEKPEFHAQP